MRIVGALDVHRKQITFKLLDAETGEVRRGRISPATRASVRRWLAPLAGSGAQFALEATTGWRFVVEEVERAGCVAHLAETAEMAARRGRKRRAKTDAADCDHMLKLLIEGRLPEAWIAPEHILELRARVSCARRWSTSVTSGSSASRRSSTTRACGARSGCARRLGERRSPRRSSRPRGAS
jgi:transposase